MNPESLKSLPLLSDMSPSQRQSLFEQLEYRRIERGRRLVSEGSEAEGLVLVQSGRVRFEADCEPHALIEEGPITLGRYALIRAGQRECTAFAETPCEIWRLSRTAYRRLFEDCPEVACRLLEALLAESAALSQEMIESFGPEVRV
ncbi:MAG: hypothetical protein CL917_11155 [Deltaproteobacteria bacterium]|nr:hypothetical protein [Deltaproteobacteria bacterium]